MKKHFITISTLLLLLVFACPADARLTLGVVIGSGDKPGSLTRDQVQNLAGQLAEKFQENIMVKELPDSGTLVDWLDLYAAVDMAFLSPEDIDRYRGRFLFVGPLDSDGHINFVTRQGVSPSLTQKAAEIVKNKGYSAWRTTDELTYVTTEPSTMAAVSETKERDQVKETADLQQDVDLESPEPQTTFTEKLSLAAISDGKDALLTPVQAKQLANRLNLALPIEVKVKEFDTFEQFVEWFMRYRMIDLAVLPEDVAEKNLGRDYIVITDASHLVDGIATRSKLIGRRGQNILLHEQLAAALTPDRQIRTEQELLTDQKAGAAVEAQVGKDKDFSKTDVEIAGDEVVAETEPDIPSVDQQMTPEDSEPLVEPAPSQETVIADQPDLPMVSETEDSLGPAVTGPSVSVNVESDIPSQPAPPEITEPLDVPTVPVSSDEEEPTKEIEKGVPEDQVVAATPGERSPIKKLSIPASMKESDPLEGSGFPEEKAEKITPAAPEIVKTSEPAKELLVTRPEERGAIETESSPAVVQDEVVSSGVPESTKTSAPSDTSGFDHSQTVAVEEEDQQILQEVLEFAEPVLPEETSRIKPVIVAEDDLQDADILALLGEDTVAALVAQPEIPQELRPPGIPVVRPGRIEERKPAIDEGLFLTSLPETEIPEEPEERLQLLPEAELDPRVVYIVPFVSIMVPKEINDRIFDRFVDTLIEKSKSLDLEFVILKEGLKKVDPRWLRVRKYVTGEIYAYVEEAGSTVVDLRAKAKLDYHKPNLAKPAFSFLYPVSKLLDRDAAVMEEERIKLADEIAEVLINEFLESLKG